MIYGEVAINLSFLYRRNTVSKGMGTRREENGYRLVAFGGWGWFSYVSYSGILLSLSLLE